MRTSRAFRVVAALLVFGLAIETSRWLERARGAEAAYHSLYLPSGKYLRLASLGYREILADVIYVWSIQYYAGVRSDRWRHLARTYDAITDLDPRFVAAYSVGALILALEADERGPALRLLDKGIEANPDTYLLAWEAAFHARDQGDMELASRYLGIAKDRPDAPSFVARWYAHTVNRLGRRDEALRVWQEAHAAARNDYERQVAERHVRSILLEIQAELLDQVIAAFRRDRGRYPISLEELVRTGYLGLVPVDPYGEPFEYDRTTGEARSRSGFLVRHRVGGR